MNNSKSGREYPVKIMIFTPFRMPGIILLAIVIALFFLSAAHFAQHHFASVGWHELASIGWNGFVST
jgi:hypothetical protein